jgi:hypothetical protein
VPAVSARRWRGHAEQRRAADRGRPAEDEPQTPLTFKRIFIQELKLNIPWASLRYQLAKVSSRPRRLLRSARLARQPSPICLPARLPALSLDSRTRGDGRCACDVRPAQIRVRNAEMALLAGGDESTAGDVAADGAADVTVKDDAAQTLDSSQMSWVYSLVTQALAILIVSSLTLRTNELHSSFESMESPST